MTQVALLLRSRKSGREGQHVPGKVKNSEPYLAATGRSDCLCGNPSPYLPPSTKILVEAPQIIHQPKFFKKPSTLYGNWPSVQTPEPTPPR